MRDKKVVILIVLSIFAVISLVYGIVASPKARVKNVQAGAQKNLQQVPASEDLSSLRRRAKRSKFTSWKRNPFTLQKAPSTAFNGLVLGGIMFDKEKPLALINNDVVKIGDNIGGNIIVDIKQDRVILNNGTSNFELKISK